MNISLINKKGCPAYFNLQLLATEAFFDRRIRQLAEKLLAKMSNIRFPAIYCMNVTNRTFYVTNEVDIDNQVAELCI